MWANLCGLRFSLLVLVASIVAGRVDAHQNYSGKTSVPLYLQESLDTHGKQIPDSVGMQEFLQYFERESGLSFEIHHLPWNRAKLMTLNGNGIIWGFSQSHERLKNYSFSDSVMRSKIWAIAYAKPKLLLRSVNDLRGKVVSVERGVSHGLAFELAKNTVFRVDEDPASPAVRFKKLLAGRCDVLLWGVVQFEQEDRLLDYLHFYYIPRLNDSTLSNRTFYASAEPLFYDSIHFASAKGHFLSEMEKLNLAIRRGIKSGELSKILRALE